MPKGRDIDQQIADLAAAKQRRDAHNDGRILIAQLKTNLHQRDYAVCLVQAQTLVKKLELLAEVPNEPTHADGSAVESQQGTLPHA